MDKNYGYKHTKGFLAFFCFILVLLLIAPAFSQTTSIDITGNLVNNTQTANTVTSTWQNGKFVSELTCWQGGDPNCSSGQPYIRPGGSINFSYGFTELYQVVNVSKALPNSGTGLVTTGFTFSWRSKVGNGWDDGRLDELKAYVQGYTKSGKWIENHNYNLTFLHDWTDYTWNQNWSEVRRPNDLANVIFGFAGKDNNYWVGPYGPEITNVNFQLKYKPDPCVTNPLFSPECPKFQETLQKNLTSTSVTTDASKPPPPPEYDSQQTFNNPKPLDDRMLGEKEPGVYEENFRDLDRLVDTLIKIDDNQQREQKITMEAASSAVQETEKNTQQVMRQAEQVANKASRLSLEVGMTVHQQTITEQKSNDSKSQQSISLFQTPNTSNSSSFQLPGALQQFNVLQPPAVVTQSASVNHNEQTVRPQTSLIVNSLQNNQPVQTTSSSISTFTNIANNVQQSSNILSSSTINLLNPLAGTSEIPTLTSNFLTNKTDPINNIIESKPVQEETKQENNTQQVKSNVQDNDVAAGVSIANIAKTPVGFNSYMVALTDANFYVPKEIYRNQKTVDNARALRQLASDRLHQQMVDQQYLPR